MGKPENETKSSWVTLKNRIAATFSFGQKKDKSKEEKAVDALKAYTSSWKMSLRWLHVIPFIGKWIDNKFGHHHEKRMQNVINAIEHLQNYTDYTENEKQEKLNQAMLQILNKEINFVNDFSKGTVKYKNEPIWHNNVIIYTYSPKYILENTIDIHTSGFWKALHDAKDALEEKVITPYNKSLST